MVLAIMGSHQVDGKQENNIGLAELVFMKDLTDWLCNKMVIW